MRLAEGTHINHDEATTRIRGGGYGSDAWIAKITGPDPKFGFSRRFMPKDTSGLSRSGASGYITFEMGGDGLYEWRNFCVGSTPSNWKSSGFCVVEGETVRKITKAEALEMVQ